MQLEHLGVAQTESLTARKYLRPLRPDLCNPVELQYSALPDTLEGVHAAAVDAEYAITIQDLCPLKLNYNLSIQQEHQYLELHHRADTVCITNLTLIIHLYVQKSKNFINKATGRAHGLYNRISTCIH
jgi:hypothetical protein